LSHRLGSRFEPVALTLYPTFVMSFRKTIRERSSILQFLCLLLSLSASLVLAIHSIIDFKLPGCGIASGCAALSASRWGHLFGISTSHIGVAWFVGIFALWLLTREYRRNSRFAARAFRWVVRIGFFMSVFFIAIIVIEQKICPWCLVVHFGNICFWALTELAGLPNTQASNEDNPLPALRPVLTSAGVAGLGLACLVTAELMRRSAVEEEARYTFEASIDRIITRSKAPGSLVPKSARQTPFAGRHRLGPEKATLRIVVFTDYQCKECQKIEPIIDEFFNNSPDGTLSVIHKHFPLCNLCNPAVPTVFHKNACQAALAAEAAGILGGKEGFHKMHHWLMKKMGEFTSEELAAALPEMGFADAVKFKNTMSDPSTAELIKTDVEEGIALGLNSTPFIFVNGEILVGLKSEDLASTLDRLSSKEDIPVAGPEFDRPILAVDKLFREWRDAESAPFPHDPETARWTIGPENAKHRVVVSVSYSNSTMKELNDSVTALAKSRNDMWLEFRQFPVSREHNPRFAKMEKELYPQDWSIARAVEAAAQLGGESAFWEINEFLLSQTLPLEDFEKNIAGFASESLGLDESEFLEAMKSDAVVEALKQDMAYVALAGRKARPSGVYLNGRMAPTWRPPGDDLWEAMLSYSPEK
jgi:protein-disulfide isomerase/uncharacterized membrane protein